MRKISIYFLTFSLFTSLHACAQAKKAGSGGTAAIQVLEASRQTTNPGRQESRPRTDYRFKIIWKSKSAPTAMHFRPDAGSWEELKVTKPVKRPGLGPNDFMIVEQNIELRNIRFGDTLSLIVPRHVHEDEAVPAAVKRLPVQSIYYQTAATGAKWLYTPVKPRVLPDINMP